MPKVYIANLGGHDFSDAQRFGELTFLTTHGFSAKELDRIAFELSLKLENYDPEQDFFLPVGQDIVNLTAFWILSQKTDEISTLYWDFRSKRYVEHVYNPNLYSQIVNNLNMRKEIINNE
ncbi:hypothetical protein DCC39_10395 [Pueribacillus theae]|uniref:Uncharacterized protein n=1 Tax=Pueribacillus theae TaxID=2171751 RepID=A0A2U1K1R0_9BACI|nr:hypothetical protein [Pueribacillus theae]PWA11099.1 hypothetical protein DCC39_10395 [Pueribacillus theae]